MLYPSFRLLNSSDAECLSSLLLNTPSEYTRFFHPFKFDELTIRKILEESLKDIFFGIDVKHGNQKKTQLVGFYMLRGMDEGYPDPMYGVFISKLWQGKGIGRLSLYHAESFCKINAYKQLLLKVNINNQRAKDLYSSAGFKFLKKVDNIDSVMLYKKI